VEAGSFYLATGGDIKMSRELRSTIHLPETVQNPPQLLASFAAETEGR
jgi:hypothetical protein